MYRTCSIKLYKIRKMYKMATFTAFVFLHVYLLSVGYRLVR